MKNWLKIMCFFTVIFFFMAGVCYSVGVKNERIRQDGNRVVFEYDLDGDRETEVSVTLTIDAKKYTANDLHLEGDYGKASPGKDKRVYWNVLQDFPRGLQGDFEAAIKASGGEIEGMVFVKGGCYDMGDTSGYGTEPVHNVCLDDYYMGKYEVTKRNGLL